MIRFVKLDSRAKAPVRANKTDAGFDICAIEDCTINPIHAASIRTGLAIEAPEGHYLQIAPRSGLAVKKGIAVLAGVIDRGYTGEIIVRLYNTYSGTDADSNCSAVYQVKAGDRIAQIIPVKIHDGDMVEVDSLDESSRGTNGFGSTGK